MIVLLLASTEVGTGFGMHDGGPPRSLEILETDFGVSGERIDSLVVGGGQFIVEEKAFVFNHYL